MLIRLKGVGTPTPRRRGAWLCHAAVLLTLVFAAGVWRSSYSRVHEEQQFVVAPNRLDVGATEASALKPCGRFPKTLASAALAHHWVQTSQASAVQLVSLQFMPAQDGPEPAESLLGPQMTIFLRGAYNDVRQVLGEMLSRHPELQLRQLQVRPAADGSAAVEAELQLVWLRVPRPLPRGAP
jgi:hypothetical protein